jgi:uncharacterized repeat protein (TIGR02543 family)
MQETFIGCTALTNTGLENNQVITSLGNGAFARCASLTETGLGNNQVITSMGNYVFAYCTALTDTGLATNSKITSVEYEAFRGCTSLIDTGLGTNQTVTAIGYSAFSACPSLIDTGLSTNTTIISLAAWAFDSCTSLGTVGTSSTNQGDLVFNSSIVLIGYGAFNNTAYTRIYLLAPIRSEVAVGGFAFNFLSGQGTLFVPESWDAGSSPITFNDGQYTYSTGNGTLVVMYAPTVDLTVGGASRIPGTSDQATIVFEADTDSTVTVKDSAGTTLCEEQASAGTPSSATFSVQEGAAESGLTIEATTSLTYPAGVQVRVYNTVSGTDRETFSVLATTYSITFNGNNADNPDAMLTDTMSLTYDQSATLISNAYMREGYTFEGWNTVQGGSGIHNADSATVTNLSNLEEGTVTLYAQWEENSVVTENPAITEDPSSDIWVSTGANPTGYKLAQTSDAITFGVFAGLAILAVSAVALLALFYRRTNRFKH